VIDLYMWPTANGKKISIMLEECGFEYKLIPINIGKGDQHTAEFLKISPNNKMPVIVDHDVEGKPVTIFESGAILQYLAEKSGKLLPDNVHDKYQVLQWLHWQIGGLGPMAGQAHHFLKYQPNESEYASSRYRTEVTRLYTVLNQRLADRDYIAGNYSIADIAAWPWIFRYEWQGQNIDDYPHLKEWFNRISQRPSVIKGITAGQEWTDGSLSDEDKKLLFNLNNKD
jgi:GST-like protein